MEFLKWPKIKRLFGEFTITEKIDGTNAQIYIEEIPDVKEVNMNLVLSMRNIGGKLYGMWVGSRKRWLSLDKDNHKFASWVMDRIDSMWELGPGRHYGEFWGNKIQRNYGLKEKRLSFFNVSRWADESHPLPQDCYTVPVLYNGDTFSTVVVKVITDDLIRGGSQAAPGFMKPEGVVVLHHNTGELFKYTLDGDGHKGLKQT